MYTMTNELYTFPMNKQIEMNWTQSLKAKLTLNSYNVCTMHNVTQKCNFDYLKN